MDPTHRRRLPEFPKNPNETAAYKDDVDTAPGIAAEVKNAANLSNTPSNMAALGTTGVGASETGNLVFLSPNEISRENRRY